MLSNLIKNSAKTLIMSLGLISAAQVHSAVVEFDLSGVGSTVNGFGRDGIYIGPNFNGANAFLPQYNWTFQDVKISIDDTTGVGTVSGSMTHNLDNSAWTINTVLNDLVVRTGTGASTTRQDYNSTSHDLSTILSTMVPGTGVEWKSLNTTVTDGVDNFSLTGFAMPKLGHVNVAELFWFDNFLNSGVQGLILDIWYQGNNLVGDTKALAAPSAVPIPAALWLFAPALMGLTALRRRASA